MPVLKALLYLKEKNSCGSFQKVLKEKRPAITCFLLCKMSLVSSAAADLESLANMLNKRKPKFTDLQQLKLVMQQLEFFFILFLGLGV